MWPQGDFHWVAYSSEKCLLNVTQADVGTVALWYLFIIDLLWTPSWPTNKEEETDFKYEAVWSWYLIDLKD